MIITALVDNRSSRKEIMGQHGLSLYIETADKNILFDTGQDDLFLKNAKLLKKSISAVDYLILSHGHYDHGGGLQYFLEHNKIGKIYIRSSAFLPLYSEDSAGNFRFIGLDENLKNNPRLIFPQEEEEIEQGIELVSGVNSYLPRASSASSLKVLAESGYEDDPFDHEQSLFIEDNGKSVLLTGCSHTGIINILNHVFSLYGKYPDVVVGGFHLENKKGIQEQELDDLIDFIKTTKAEYYTCHCTGLKETEYLLKNSSKIKTIRAGDRIIL